MYIPINDIHKILCIFSHSITHIIMLTPASSLPPNRRLSHQQAESSSVRPAAIVGHGSSRVQELRPQGHSCQECPCLFPWSCEVGWLWPLSRTGGHRLLCWYGSKCVMIVKEFKLVAPVARKVTKFGGLGWLCTACVCLEAKNKYLPVLFPCLWLCCILLASGSYGLIPPYFQLWSKTAKYFWLYYSYVCTIQNV